MWVVPVKVLSENGMMSATVGHRFNCLDKARQFAHDFNMLLLSYMSSVQMRAEDPVFDDEFDLSE